MEKFNRDFCAACGMAGDLICCDKCPKSFHTQCITKDCDLSGDEWICVACEGGFSEWTLQDIDLTSPQVYEYTNKYKQTTSRGNSKRKEELDYFPSLAALVLMLELMCLPSAMVPIASSVSQYINFFDGEVSDSVLLGQLIHLGSSKLKPLNLHILLNSIRRLAGAVTYDDAISYLVAGGHHLALGMRPSMSKNRRQCISCHTGREFNTFCYRCGCMFDVVSEIMPQLQQQRAFESKRRVKTSSHFEVSEGAVSGLVAADCALPYPCGSRQAFIQSIGATAATAAAAAAAAKPVATMPNLAAVTEVLVSSERSHQTSSESEIGRSRLCDQVALRALHQMHSLCLEPKAFDLFGGDMLFLIRNLAVCTRGIVQEESIRCFKEVFHLWSRKYSKLNLRELESIGDFEYAIEALQVVMQCRRGSSLESALYRRHDDVCKAAIISSDVLLPDLSSVLLGLCDDGPSTKRSREHEKYKYNSASQYGEQEDDDEDCDNSSADELRKKKKKRAKKAGMKAAAKQSVMTGKNPSSTTLTPHRSVVVWTKPFEFDLRHLSAHIRKCYLSRDVSEVLGFDPSRGRLPLTTGKQCGHCGYQSPMNSAGRDCDNCGHVIRPTIDYGSMTDALVKLFVVQDAGIQPMFFGGCSSGLHQVLQYLPVVRSYQPVDAIGHNFFKLQCYFVTHLIYVFSDWGQHALRRHIFTEEFEFIVLNMNMAIRLEDPEIVAEFLQCLKILEYNPAEDRVLVPLVQAGVDFLLSGEQAGCWVTHNASLHSKRSASGVIYDRYHSSYCAAIGLVDYGFMRGPTLEFPQPRIFQLVLSSQ